MLGNREAVNVVAPFQTQPKTGSWISEFCSKKRWQDHHTSIIVIIVVETLSGHKDICNI